MSFDWQRFPHYDLEAAKKFGCAFYAAIDRVRCPAFNGEYVAFNSKGIGHILYKRTRTPQEIIRRLFYLQYAEAIIADSNAKVLSERRVEKEYIKKNGVHKLCEVDARYWNFMKSVESSLVIKLVVRQINNGGKYFYSIMAL